ncbi:MAG TPA: ribokinase [Ramlibacter sp.]|nr:ribokinase [Ramlibacter sp.]
MPDRPPRSKVVVFGSLNMDLVARVPRMPEAGETLAGHSFITNPGGKGANQAVACARQGARVDMAGRVGNDAFGAELRAALQADGIDIQGVIATATSTGVAMIMVDDAAQNCIAIVPGANASVSVEDAEALRGKLADARVLVLQFEVPMEPLVRAAAISRELGCTVMLNPAPAKELPDALWPLVDILVLNEIEARLLSELPSVNAENATDAAALLLKRGPKHVIVTLGSQGVVWATAGAARHFEAVKVTAVDTTAAGDTFIGALSAMLVEGATMEAALRHAIKAAAICVTRAGAQASIPSRAEVEGVAT